MGDPLRQRIESTYRVDRGFCSFCGTRRVPVLASDLNPDNDGHTPGICAACAKLAIESLGG